MRPSDLSAIERSIVDSYGHLVENIIRAELRNATARANGLNYAPNKLTMIRETRNVMACGLAEAKHVVEHIAADRDLYTSDICCNNCNGTGKLPGAWITVS